MAGDQNQAEVLDLEVNEDREVNVIQVGPGLFLPEFRIIERLDSVTSSPTDETESELSSQFGTDNKQVEFQQDAVSGLNECLVHQARKLCIFDLAVKLSNSDHYDIGGTYSIQNSLKKSELWFYCTTSVCPNTYYILNLFVCHRNVGSFAMGISDTNLIRKTTISGDDNPLIYLTLSNTLSWKTFKTCEIDESHHVKSFCFSKSDLKLLQNRTLFIPIEININPSRVLDKNIILRIKQNHNLSGLFRRHEMTDFTLESTSGKKYEIHKVLLAAHSSVLRNIMKNSKSDTLVVNIDDDGMELFLEYIYTGSVVNISEHNCCQIIEMAEKYELEYLFRETEIAITQQISVENAVDIAVLSEKYKLHSIQKRVIEFMKDNRKVLETESWKKLNDVDLAKKLFKEMYYVDST